MPEGVADDPGLRLLELYDTALPQVYGYLLARCGGRAVAEDVTAETFLAAVEAARKPGAPLPSVGWLIGIARHKLADHWRALERDRRKLETVAAQPDPPDDPWQRQVDVLRAHDVLARLRPQYRAALTLRYLDGLPVPEVAAVLQRTVHATETLLVRAKSAFRSAYRDTGGDDRD